jgi:hypothetical protein
VKFAPYFILGGRKTADILGDRKTADIPIDREAVCSIGDYRPVPAERHAE